MEFIYDNYSNLIDALLSKGYRHAFFTDDIDDDTILIRHDVDFSPGKVIDMAEIEEKNGVRATYFFILTSPLYNVMTSEIRGILSRLRESGHRIGLHFDSHQYWDSERPGKEEVEQKVASELEILSEVVGDDVDVVSFHKPPEWVFNEEFEGFISTYERRFFGELSYISDSNQRWREENPLNSLGNYPVHSLTHPVLWSDQDDTKNELLRKEKRKRTQQLEEEIKKAFI